MFGLLATPGRARGGLPSAALSRRAANMQKWIRRLHAWVGLSLSMVFLLFALTGFLLNHRSVLKIPALQRHEVREVVALETGVSSPQALAARLLPPPLRGGGTQRVVVEAPREVEWDGRVVRQPARWTIHHDTPSQSLRIEHWVGSGRAEILRMRPNLWLRLARLHMSIGTGPAWTLLADAVAVSFAALALSGFWLWGRLHGSRSLLAMLALFGGATALLIGLYSG